MTTKQTVLIAGATGNVGGGAALALARRGVHVVLLGRDSSILETRAEAICSDLPDYAEEPDIDTLAFDLSDMKSVRRAATQALDRFESIDALVLSAVTLAQDGPHVLPNGHELMFATNVMGPFLLTNLLLPRMAQTNGLVLHVVAPFHEAIDWDDLESIEHHKTGTAYNRTKTMTRAIAAELARRHGESITSVAYSPPFTIDKKDPRLAERWPKGFMGLWWRALTLLIAKPPVAAGEPLADLVTDHPDRKELNGGLYKRNGRAHKADKAMGDTELGRRLWDELARLTGSTSE